MSWLFDAVSAIAAAATVLGGFWNSDVRRSPFLNAANPNATTSASTPNLPLWLPSFER
ncbi:MAG: hypothetical protein WDM89_04295 [Rhizomicrobium sp.]